MKKISSAPTTSSASVEDTASVFWDSELHKALNTYCCALANLLTEPDLSASASHTEDDSGDKETVSVSRQLISILVYQKHWLIP